MKKKAFTLVELLVAMAIIGVLIALAIFGISLVQKASRDTQRRSGVNDIKLAITDYYNRSNTLPAPGSIGCLNGDIMVGLNGDDYRIRVKLTGSARCKGTSYTDANNTRYCYTQAGTGGYVLGVQLEPPGVGSGGADGDNWENKYGEGTGSCTSINTTAN